MKVWDKKNIESWDALFLLDNQESLDKIEYQESDMKLHITLNTNKDNVFSEILNRLEFYDKYKDKV